MRVDTALPSDTLASTGFGAFTAQRVTSDATPHDYYELVNWVRWRRSPTCTLAA